MASCESRLGQETLEGLGEGVKEVDILLLQGGEVGTDGAEDISTFLGSESAGDFLFDPDSRNHDFRSPKKRIISPVLLEK